MCDDTIVMKFGGASLATPDHFDLIAERILHRTTGAKRIVVVVSAMGKTTDELIRLAQSVNTNPPQREYDMLLSVGERISMSLLAMTLHKKGREAQSFTGSQSGIITSSDHTEAKIVDVRPKRILSSLEKGYIVIVAGFQGVSTLNEITTLGRGGSDSTAVALGIALEAKCVEFYKDVPGFFSDDPKTNPDAKFLSSLSYDEAIGIVSHGGRILHKRSIIMAKKHAIPLHILPFDPSLHHAGGSLIRGEGTGRPLEKVYERDFLELAQATL